MRNFRKTLLTIVLFVVLAAVFSGVIMAVYFRGENYYYQDIKERDEVSGTLDFVITGASQGMTSLVPTLLDEELSVDSYNLSISAASMRERCKLLEVELERNPIDTVVVELSHDALTRTAESRGHEGAFYLLAKLKLRDRIPYFFQTFSLSDYDVIYSEVMDKGLSCLKMFFTGTWTGWNYKIDKGYAPLYEGNPYQNWMADNFSEHYNLYAYEEVINEPEVEYLNQILDLCEENDIEVILTTVMVSETEICENSNFDEITGWYQQIADERGLTYIDFNLYKEHYEMFSDQEDFNDDIHLSRKGAEKFTKLFSEIYTMIQNGEDVSDLFYDSYEELEADADYTQNVN